MVINRIMNIIRSKNVIKDTTCLLLATPGDSPNLVFRFFVASLLLVAIHANTQIMDTIKLHENTRTNNVIIFYVLL
jgi:hypothetical protein